MNSVKHLQTSIFHYYNEIPGFENVGKGIIRSKDGKFNFLETVKRMRGLLLGCLYETPLYGYELLNNVFQCDCKFKMDNMERYGDHGSRIVASIIISNFLNQQDRLGQEMQNAPGVVLVMNPKDLDIYLDTVAMFAINALDKKVVIFCPKADFSLVQSVQLFNCKEAGSTIIFQDDMTSCSKEAQKYAEENKYIFIDNRFSFQFGMIGTATIAYEILESQPQTQTIIVPVRIYNIGFPLVAGVAILAKTMKPSVRIALAQLEEEASFDRRGLFPDILEIGWKSLINKSAHMYSFFESLDVKNIGTITREDVNQYVHSLGNSIVQHQLNLDMDQLHLPDFVIKVSEEYFKLWNNTLESDYASLTRYMSLDNLKSHQFVDEVIKITEDEAALAFQHCLEYTHTQADGRGVLPLAALWNSKIQVEGQYVVGIISGGFVDLMNFQTLLDYSLGLSGHNFTLSLELPDSTTSLSKILTLLGSNNVSVHDVTFDRTGSNTSLYNIRIFIQCLSKGYEQQRIVFSLLEQQGYRVQLKTPGAPKTLEDRPKYEGKKKATDGHKSKGPLKVRDIWEVTPETIKEAWERIKGNALRTPIYFDKNYSDLCGCKVYLKFENIQKTGSFKIRGSSNMVLKTLESSNEKPKGLAAASAGNHAQGVALVSAKVGVPCAIVCPVYAPDTKLNWTRKYGAEVYKKGDTFEEAVETAEKLCKERDWLLVKPFNDVDIIEGQGTMGMEIFQDIPDVDTVMVNVGGGGMIAGIALYLKRVNPKIRIIGIQSEVVAPLLNFKQTEALRYIPVGSSTIADGVNVRVPGGVHNPVLRDYVDEYVTVSENEIASTIVNLLSSSRTLSEGAGCLGLAALLHKKVSVRPDEKVCVVICGGNLDMSTLKQIYEYGLRSLGRFFTIHLTTSDSPGNLAKVIALAAQSELKVHEVRHIRGIGDINWNEVTISMSFYSNSFKHQLHFLTALANQGKVPKIVGREFIKHHEEIYLPYDSLVQQKKQQQAAQATLVEQNATKAQNSRLNSTVM